MNIAKIDSTDDLLKINHAIEKKFNKITQGNRDANLRKLQQRMPSLQSCYARESLQSVLDSNRRVLAKIEEAMGDNAQLAELHRITQHFMLVLQCNLLRQSAEINFENKTIVQFKEFIENHSDPEQIASYLAQCDDQERLYALLFLLTQPEEHPFSRKELKKLLASPGLKTKYFNDSQAMHECLKIMIPFIFNYQNKIQNPFLIDCLNGYLADCIAFLTLFSDHQGSFSSELLFFLQQLRQKQTLPPSLQSKIKTLLDLASPVSLEKNIITLNSEEITRETRELYRGLPGATPENLLAIDVSNIVEGSDFKTNGIRKRIHQKPGPEVLFLLTKHVDEFLSGRRNFAFYEVKSVDINNYKTVMLYLIRALKEDKEKYYKKHPDYINPQEYEKAKVQLIEADSQSSLYYRLSLEDKYVFEFYSEKLISLKASIEEALKEREIIDLLNQFEKSYCRIPNHNMNITVCTGISSRGLSLTHTRKPVITNHPPYKLLELKEMLGGKGVKGEELRSLFEILKQKVKCLPEGAMTFKKALSAYVAKIKNADYDAPKKKSWWKKEAEVPESLLAVQKEQTHSLLQVMFAADPCLKQLESFWLLQEFLSKFVGISSDESESYRQKIFDLSSELESYVDDEKIKNVLNYFQEVFLPKEKEILKDANGREIVNELEPLYLECEELLRSFRQDYYYKVSFFKREVYYQKVAARKLNQRELAMHVNHLQYDVSSELNLSPRKLLELEGRLLVALNQTEYYSQGDPDKPAQTNQFIQLEESVRAILEAKGYLSRKFCRKQQNNPALFRDAHATIRYLEKIENSLSELIVGFVEKSTDKKEKLKALNLIIEMACRQNLIKLDLLDAYPQSSGDLQQLQDTLTERRNHSLKGYEALKVKFINSNYVQEALLKQNKALDNACQFIKGDIKEGLLISLDRVLQLISQEMDHGKIGEDKIHLHGYANEERVILGKVRVVEDISEFQGAKSGEILIVNTMPPEIHKYRHAAAVISEEGGIFSHTAIDLKDLGIPFICGVKEALKRCGNLNGAMILLTLSKKKEDCFLQIMAEDVSEVMTRLRSLSKDHPESFSAFFEHLNSLSLSAEVKKLITDQALDKIFLYDHSSIMNICRLILPVSEDSFLRVGIRQKIESDKEKLDRMSERFETSGSVQEKKFLFAQIKRKLEVISTLGDILDSDLHGFAETVNKKLLSNTLKSVESGPVFDGGKAEGLCLVKEVISQENLPFNLFALDVPEFSVLKQKSLADPFYEQLIDGLSLKERILAVIKNQALDIEERQREIETLFTKAELSSIHQDDLEKNFNGLKRNSSPLIVRSSCAIEDRHTIAAAGLFDSIKGIEDIPQVHQAVMGVLKSSFSLRSLDFWSSFPNFEPEKLFQMDVIIQQEISEAAFSGVGFSVAHEDNWDEAAFQVNQGLGCGVDGTTTPNLAVVDTKHDVMTSLDIHQKDLYLSPDMIKEIAHILKWLEENFGCPVDVEFLVTRTNSNQLKFSIVQVRPITHLMMDSIRKNYNINVRYE